MVYPNRLDGQSAWRQHISIRVDDMEKRRHMEVIFQEILRNGISHFPLEMH